MSRLVWLGAGLAIGAASGVAYVNYLQTEKDSKRESSVSLGKVTDYKVGEMKYIEPSYMVFRTENGFQAISALCTKEGCSRKPFTAADANHPVSYSVCPCCGSVFSRAGEVLSGPATKVLPFFAMTMDSIGRLTLDTGRFDSNDPYAQRTGKGVSNALYLNPDTRKMEMGPIPG